MVPTNRRSRLKAATDNLHRRIDAHVGEAGFLETLHGYGDYLLRTLQARATVETMLDHSGAERLYPAWPQRRIADALREDLDALGFPERPAPPAAAATLGPGGVLGALYVLEGSAVGARFIARQAAGLGVDADRGARHLRIQTADPKAFRAFLDVLEAAPLDAEHEQECLDAAIATFERFERSYTA